MEWLGGIVVGVLGTLIATWLLRFLNRFVPTPKQSSLAIENLFQAKTPVSEDRFCFVLCWLENDCDGDNASIVAQAFSNIQGVTLVRSARIVKASGAADDWRPAMQRNARNVLERWQADLAVVGLVKESGKALSLWFVPRSGDGTLARGDQPYELAKATLGPDFHEDLRAQITALALAAVAPLAKSETRGRVLKEGLTEATEKLAALIGGPTIDQPERRIALQWTLGVALQTLGERERGTARLEQAVATFRAALEEYTRERVPLQWAAMQTHLGTALQTLGERERGPERLEQAIKAHRAALEEYTRERAPLQWAATQNNLGITLGILGERERGTTRLEQAVEAFHSALEVLSRERVPLEWAATQNNLGNALLALGERESRPARFEQAVEAYRAALLEYTRERVPLDWAGTQNNLGNALRTLGGRERLEQAVKAHRAALEEWTRERVPLQWAATQHNLGNALAILGERERSTAYLELAIKAYRVALEERTRERVPIERTHPRARSDRVGHDAAQPRQRPSRPRRAGARHDSPGTGRGGLPRSARCLRFRRTTRAPRLRAGKYSPRS